MEDFADLWDRYSIDFCKKLEYNCGGDWNGLDADEQELAAFGSLLWICITADLSSFSATGAIRAIGTQCEAFSG